MKMDFGFRERDTHGENMEHLLGRAKASARPFSVTALSPIQSCPVTLSDSVFRSAFFPTDFSALLAFSLSRTEFQ